jgi:CBS domain-containing protein
VKVTDLMTTRFAVVPAQATLADAAEEMRRLDVGVLPVADAGELVGVLTDRDIAVRAVAAGADPNRLRVREAMTPGVAACSVHDEVAEVIRRMERERVRRLVVRDDDGQIVGLVSVDDLAHRFDDEGAADEVLGELPESGPDADF